MALEGQIEVAARPDRKPVIDNEWTRREHVLGGVGRTYGHPEGDERVAAHRNARRLANRHGCTPSVNPTCTHPQHAADVEDARTLLLALALIAEPETAAGGAA